MRGKVFIAAVCFLVHSALIILPCIASDLRVQPYIPERGTRSAFKWCTGIFFIQDTEWVISLKDSSLFFRSKGEGRFSRVSLELNQPHSIAYNPRDSLYYLVDTDNHRLLYSADPVKGSSWSAVRSLAGLSLKRPHDVLVDPESDWVYVLNPAPVQLFRFKEIGVQEQILDLSTTLVYARSLSLINGKVYVVGSASGKVVEVIDFSDKKFKVYASPGKVKNNWSGSWQETGLVGNDLEFYDDYWYLTSYFFTESCAAVPCDFDKNKFIRFSSWQEFEQGNWQDLSALLPSGLVPYFLTVHDNALFVGVYNHTFPGKGDAIYKMVTEK